MLTQTNADLAALIGSRICHDLISPIGAIANGLELLDMAGGPSGPEMDLISESAGNAGARIRFFRIAYGAASDQVLGASEISGILDGISAGSRSQYRWCPDSALPRAEVRLAFLAIQCCESALPYGGSITVTREQHWSVRGTGASVSANPDLWGLLNGEDSGGGFSPATVQFPLLAELARSGQRQLRAVREEDAVSVEF